MTDTPEAPQADESPADVERGLASERNRRLEQINDLRKSGVNPYPYRFDRSHTLAEIRAAHGSLEAGSETDVTVAVAGRVLLKRDQGKLIFATLRDRDGEIQLFVSKAVVGDELFDHINSLDLGDWVEAFKLIEQRTVVGKAVLVP